MPETGPQGLTPNTNQSFKLFKSFLGSIKQKSADNEAIDYFCRHIMHDVDILKTEDLYRNLESIDERCGILEDDDRYPLKRHDLESITCKFYSCRKQLQMLAKNNLAQQSIFSVVMARLKNDYKKQWFYAYTARILHIIETKSNSLASQINALKAFIASLEHLKTEAIDLYSKDTDKKFAFIQQIQQTQAPFVKLRDELYIFQKQLDLKDKIEQLNNDLVGIIGLSSHCLAFNAFGASGFEPLENETQQSLTRFFSSYKKEIDNDWVLGCYTFPVFLLYMTAGNEHTDAEHPLPKFKVNMDDYRDRVNTLHTISQELETLDCTTSFHNNDSQQTKEQKINKRNQGLNKVAHYINKQFGEKMYVAHGRIKFIGANEDDKSAINKLVLLWAKRFNKSTEQANQMILHIQSIYASFCWRLSNIVYLQDLQNDLASEAANIGQIAIAKFNPLTNLFLAAGALCKHHVDKLFEISQLYYDAIQRLSCDFQKDTDSNSKEHKAIVTDFVYRVKSVNDMIQNFKNRDNNIENQVNDIKCKLNQWVTDEHCKKTAQRLQRVFEGCWSVFNNTQQVDNNVNEAFESLGLDVNKVMYMPAFTGDIVKQMTEQAGSDVMEKLQAQDFLAYARQAKYLGESQNHCMSKLFKDPQRVRKERFLRTLGMQADNEHYLGSPKTWSRILTLFALKFHKLLEHSANYQDAQAINKFPGVSVENVNYDDNDEDADKWYLLPFESWLQQLAIKDGTYKACLEKMLRNLSKILSRHRIEYGSVFNTYRHSSKLEHKLCQMGLKFNGSQVAFRRKPTLAFDAISVKPNALLDDCSYDPELANTNQPFTIVVLMALLADEKATYPEKRALVDESETQLNLSEINQVALQTLQQSVSHMNQLKKDKETDVFQTRDQKQLIDKFKTIFNQNYQQVLNNKVEAQNQSICQNRGFQRPYYPLGSEFNMNTRAKIDLCSTVEQSADYYRRQYMANGVKCPKRSHKKTIALLRQHNTSYDMKHLMLNLYGYVGNHWRTGAKPSLRVRILNQINKQLNPDYQVQLGKHEKSIKRDKAKNVIKGLLQHNYTSKDNNQASLINVVVDTIYQRLLKNGNKGLCSPNKRIAKAANLLQHFKSIIDYGYQYKDLSRKLYKRWCGESIWQSDTEVKTNEQVELENRLDTFIQESDRSTSLFRFFFIRGGSYTSDDLKAKLQHTNETQTVEMSQQQSPMEVSCT